ncbi:MAG: NERD domain-containing protein [Eubacteriales bacterium]
MHAKDEILRPVFIEKDSDGEKDIAELEKIMQKAPQSEKTRLEKQIANTKRGITGENNIIFELKNCDIPMVCIHNLYLVHEDISAQIDFVFVMRDKVYVVESKNLYGEIEVNERGEFHRIVNGNQTRMYSPVTQCQHHLQLMIRLRESIGNEEYIRLFTEKYYDNNIFPLIVISNSSCKLNLSKAPKEIADIIIHSDQLAKYIMEHDNKNDYITQRAMENFANFYSTYHKENPRAYMNPYRKLLEETKKPSPPQKSTPEPKAPTQPPETTTPVCKKCGAPMVVRASKEGKYAGVKFYGCSTYPKCKYSDFSKETTDFLNKNSP